MATLNSAERIQRRSFEQSKRADVGNQGAKKGLIQTLGSGRMGKTLKAGALAAGIMSQGFGGAGQARQHASPQRQEYAQRMNAMRGAPTLELDNFSRAPADDQIGDEQDEMGMKREFDRQKNREQAGETAVQADQEQGSESQGGIRGKLAQIRNQFSQTRALASNADEMVAVGAMSTEAANKLVKSGVQTAWTWLHNVLEGSSYSILIMLVGPFATLATLVHFTFWLALGRILTVQMGGVEVPLFPSFTVVEAGPRVANFFIITCGWVLAWGALGFLIWMLVDPSGALRAVGAPWIAQFLAKFVPSSIIFNLIK